jgi:hypothetical protein
VSLITKEREVREMRAAETILGVIDEREALESRMRGNVHVRFGGRRMEKGAVGCPSLPMHHGRTNSDVSRNLASRLPYFTLKTSRAKIAELIGSSKSLPLFEPRYNIAPSQPVLAVRIEPKRGEREGTMLKWAHPVLGQLVTEGRRSG